MHLGKRRRAERSAGCALRALCMRSHSALRTLPQRCDAAAAAGAGAAARNGVLHLFSEAARGGAAPAGAVRAPLRVRGVRGRAAGQTGRVTALSHLRRGGAVPARLFDI
jgi:hypothetical protein